MDKYNVVCLHNGTLFSHEKEWNVTLATVWMKTLNDYICMQGQDWKSLSVLTLGCSNVFTTREAYTEFASNTYKDKFYKL
jgi:hypothetical protein